MDNLKNLFYLLPVMVYYFIESTLISIPIYYIWKYVLSSCVDVNIRYIEWVLFIFIVKLIFFDVFKMTLSPMNNKNNIDNEININDQNE